MTPLTSERVYVATWYADVARSCVWRCLRHPRRRKYAEGTQTDARSMAHSAPIRILRAWKGRTITDLTLATEDQKAPVKHAPGSVSIPFTFIVGPPVP